MTVHRAHGGPSGKSEAGGGGHRRGRQAGPGTGASLAASWSRASRVPCCHTGSLLMRAAPDAFCTEGDNFLLV